MITTLNGYNAPINALKPVGIYLRLQVLNPFAKTNISIPIQKASEIVFRLEGVIFYTI
jgi:hypothetical protein